MFRDPNEGPGPADYNTLEPQPIYRPLTSHKSHSVSAQHFNKARKDTMKVSVYDRAYERSYKNRLGPGPAAYSQMYNVKATDKFRRTAFPR